MGTENVILLAGDDEEHLRQAAAQAFATMERLEGMLSKFRPESDVSLVNILAADRPVEVGEDLLYLLKVAREGWRITAGAFDPTVGPLLEAWGLVDMEGRVPETEEVERLLRLRGMDHVIVDEEAGTVRFDRPGVMIDMGGIGKGYTADVVTTRFGKLKEHVFSADRRLMVTKIEFIRYLHLKPLPKRVSKHGCSEVENVG